MADPNPFHPPVSDEYRFERFHEILHGTVLAQIRHAADCNQPHLALIGLSAWVDTVARIATARTRDEAWREYIQTYVEDQSEHAARLYANYRCGILHAFSTDDIALSATDSGWHGLVVDGFLILELPVLLDAFAAGYRRFYEAARSNSVLYKRVCDASDRLIGSSHVQLDPSGTGKSGPGLASPDGARRGEHATTAASASRVGSIVISPRQRQTAPERSGGAVGSPDGKKQAR